MENKYKNFSDFNCDSRYLAEYVRNNTIGMSIAQQIEYARKVYTKDLLNSRLTIGFLSDDVKNILGSNAKLLNFSMDNMIKNRLAHPEVTDEDYVKIVKIIKSP